MPTAIIYDKWLGGLGGGEVVACTMARILKDNGYDVLFLSKDKVPTDRIKNTLGIDLSDIAFGQVSSERDIKSLATDVFINISFMDYSYGIGKKNIYYVHFPSQIRSGLFNHVLSFFEKTKLYLFFPKMLRERIDDRLKAGIYPDMQKRLDSYDTFICHSEFVKKWIKKMWNKEAVVIYPPVKLLTTSTKGLGQRPITLWMILPSGQKKNWITSIGRFFTLGHGKKQEILIEAFKRLTEAVKEERSDGKTASVDSKWQLHLVGGVGREPSSLRYVEQLKKMAKGYPIFFHFDAKREEVEKILLQSKIYWHAGGYGETNPINFEHFGIAPVEAISAGCLPVLFNGGGLTEIVQKLKLNPSHHLFNTVTELVESTKLLLSSQNPGINNCLVSLFSLERYRTKFITLLNEK